MAKAINNAEMLSMEELNNVVGGSLQETAQDCKFLYDMEILKGTYSTKAIGDNWDVATKIINDAWAKAGVTCIANKDGENEYWIGDKRVTRWRATKTVAKKVDYNWWNGVNELCKV